MELKTKADIDWDAGYKEGFDFYSNIANYLLVDGVTIPGCFILQHRPYGNKKDKSDAFLNGFMEGTRYGESTMLKKYCKF